MRDLSLYSDEQTYLCTVMRDLSLYSVRDLSLYSDERSISVQ